MRRRQHSQQHLHHPDPPTVEERVLRTITELTRDGELTWREHHDEELYWTFFEDQRIMLCEYEELVFEAQAGTPWCIALDGTEDLIDLVSGQCDEKSERRERARVATLLLGDQLPHVSGD